VLRAARKRIKPRIDRQDHPSRVAAVAWKGYPDSPRTITQTLYVHLRDSVQRNLQGWLNGQQMGGPVRTSRVVCRPKGPSFVYVENTAGLACGHRRRLLRRADTPRKRKFDVSGVPRAPHPPPHAHVGARLPGGSRARVTTSSKSPRNREPPATAALKVTNRR